MDQSCCGHNDVVRAVREKFAVRNRTLSPNIAQTVERTDKDGATGVVN